MLPFQRYRLRAGEQTLHVMEQGEGRPVLCLHGNPTWGFLWRKVAAEIAGEPLRLVMPDLVGLGYSDRPRDASWHTLERHAEAIGALIDALDLRDLILVVQDWGGPIGLCAMAERRERLGALVLLNTVVGPPREGFRATAFHRLARLPILSELLFRGLGFPQVWLGPAQGDRASMSGAVGRAYRLPLRGLANNAAPLALARMVPDSRAHPSIPALARAQEVVTSFTGPTAIVWGDRDPVLGRVRSHLERLLPQARVWRTQAGHFLQEEVPREIAQAIRWVNGPAAPRG
jgi:cis-3-alkyl-4-acyloxetan-2-one decarboxylase